MRMRYLARSAAGRPLAGDEEGFVPLGAVYPDAAGVRDVLPRAPGGLRDPTGDDVAASPTPWTAESLGPAVGGDGKLLGIGLNYADHAADLSEDRPDEPASFFKPASAATGPGGPIRLPPESESERVTAEAELAVVIGRTCSDVPADRADDVIAGYLPVIDVTAEDVLARNPRFLTRAKSYDTFLVLGPRLAVPGPDGSFADLEVRTVVDGTVEARNVVGNMRFSPRELVAFHSRVMTLEPGDLVSTGTPGAYRSAPATASAPRSTV